MSNKLHVAPSEVKRVIAPVCGLRPDVFLFYNPSSSVANPFILLPNRTKGLGFIRNMHCYAHHISFMWVEGSL